MVPHFRPRIHEPPLTPMRRLRRRIQKLHANHLHPHIPKHAKRVFGEGVGVYPDQRIARFHVLEAAIEDGCAGEEFVAGEEGDEGAWFGAGEIGAAHWEICR